MKKYITWLRQHKKITVITASVIVLLAIVGAIFGSPGPMTPAPATTAPAAPAITTNQAPSSKQPIAERDAEDYCQNPALLSKYVDISNVSIIYVTNYNEYYSDSGSFDQNGNPIYVLQWDGHYKHTSNIVPFVCQVSGGDSKNILLHSLTINGTTVYGT